MRSLAAVALFLFAAVPSRAAGSSDPRDLLCNGVTSIGAPGLPGDVAIFGEHAWPILIGGDAKQPVPVVAAAEVAGGGRVVVLGHEGYLAPNALSEADTGRLVANAVCWAGRSDRMTRKIHATSWRGRRPETAAWLINHDERLMRADPDDAPVAEGPSADVLLVNAHDLKADDIEPLQAWVRDGGGLVVAGLGWGWQQVHPDASLRDDFLGNTLLRPFGLAFGGESVSPKGDRYAVGDMPSPLLNATRAAAALAKLVEENAAADVEARAASGAVVRTVRALAPGDEWVAANVGPLEAAYLKRFDGPPVPTPQQPLGQKDIRGLAGRSLLAADLDRLAHAAAEDVTAHPAAKDFPGVVAFAPEMLVQVSPLELGRPGWQSTGLYLPPGRVVTVTPGPDVPPGLRVRVGSHSDELWHLAAWKRVPSVSMEVVVDGATKMSSPFGGEIYFIAPESGPADAASVNINGPVWVMPRYVSGQTTPQQWRESIRDNPAPWAEIDAGPIILTAPSEAVRNLDDPEKLCEVWRNVSAACADLAGIPRDRERPERFVADLQISVGYMHAGYPIMIGLDVAPRMLDAGLLTSKGDWGLFHEIGHNHQQSAWTFSGTGEVTNNLFTLYCMKEITGRDEGRDGLYGDARRQRIEKYLAAGARFAEWKSDPFLALLSYMQLQEAFGWEAYKDVFAEYRKLPAAELPKSDRAKRDEWMKRFSRRVGRNLGPFFDGWGIPVSDAAKTAVADLPAWMPPDWPTQPATRR